MCIRTYTEGLLLGSLCGLVGPGQGRWVVSRWTLNGALGGVPYSHVGMQRAFGMCGWVRGGSEGQQGGRGSPRSCGGDSRRGWAVGWATSVSETHTIYMHTYVHGGVAPGIVTQSSRGFRGVSDYLPSNTLKLMVLTSVYAEDLDNAPVDV